MAGYVADPPPAVRREARRRVVGKPVLDVAVDADAVVVVDRNQFREPEGAGQRAGLVADAFHEAAVADEHPGAVIDDRMAGAVELSSQQLLGEGHADRVGETLPQRSGRGLHASGHAELRVTGCLAVQLAEALQLLERQRVAGEVQQRVQEHRAMSVRQHEAVAVRPVRIGRIVFQVAAPQHFGDFRHAHGHAGVATVGGLHGIDGEEAQRIAKLLACGQAGPDFSIHAGAVSLLRTLLHVDKAQDHRREDELHGQSHLPARHHDVVGTAHP